MAITTVPQGVIRVDVDFYDDVERDALLKYPTADSLRHLVASSPLEIPTAEFLTYYLFHRKKLGTLQYRNYKSISSRISQATETLDGCVDLNRSIHTARGVVEQLIDVTEHIGEGIGLAVASRIHDLTEADWGLLRPKRGPKALPSFDFEIASDGQGFVQVENKGSSARDNRVKSPSVKQHRREIATKKRKLRVATRLRTDPYPAALRYGTITVVDGRSKGNVRCWLTDPPSTDAVNNPRRFRLLRRVKFLRDWISFISGTSQLAVALSTRAVDLDELENPFELDRVALRRGNNRKFSFGSMRTLGNHSTFFWTKSRVSDGPAGGVVLQLSSTEMFFAGIREDLVSLAAEQDFGRILEYRAEVGTLEKTVDCVFSESRFLKLSLPGSVRERAIRSGNYFSFDLDGVLHYSPAGLVFGVLRLPAS